MPAFARAILIQESAEGGLSYKVKNGAKIVRPIIIVVLILLFIKVISNT